MLKNKADEARKSNLNRSGKGHNQRLAIDALRDAINTKGLHWKVSVGTRKVVRLEDWRAAFAQKLGSDDVGESSFKKAWGRVRDAEKLPSWVRIEGENVWIEDESSDKSENF